MTDVLLFVRKFQVITLIQSQYVDNMILYPISLTPYFHFWQFAQRPTSPESASNINCKIRYFD